MLLLASAALHAATIRGSVVENQTGHPLSHASVVLDPIPGSGGKHMAVHTSRYGFFEFDGAAAGVYTVHADRPPFLTAYYGQKRWNSAGMPLTVADTEDTFVTIRMMRYAAISGTVVDENDVGQPFFEVAAYRNTLPVQLVANAPVDERGAYRLSGLLPGTYLVRSVGKELEGIGYKPTFAHEAEAVDEGRRVDVDLEQEARDVKLRPLPGKLLTLNVGATAIDPPLIDGVPVTVTLTLVSEMSRQTIEAASHTFTGLPRGDYEVFAEAPTETEGVKQGAYERISLGKDTSILMTLRRIYPVTFQFSGLPLRRSSDSPVKVLGRRKDLAGSHDTQVIKLIDGAANLTVGPWEFALAPLDGYYVSGFSAPGQYRMRSLNQRADGWNEATITGGSTVGFRLASNPSALHGTVTDNGNPVVGAPVFVEPMDLEPARRITDTYAILTDVHGQYRLGGLAPGRYRLLSSFEYLMPDSKIMADAGAKELQIDVHTDVAQDLSLYVIR